MRKQIYLVMAVSGALLFMLSFLNSCILEDTFAKATVETSQVTSITEATATCAGIIITDEGSKITTRGFCWSTSPIPTIENDTTFATSGTPNFSSSIKGLTPGTTYYVRAFAVNKGGVAYGLDMDFTTKTFSITTTPISVSLLTATSAIGGGNIISDGDSSTLTVKARGVCWNTFPSSTIENCKTTDGVGGGRFTSYIDSLIAFTTYYARAYVTNSNGTIYGNEVCFTTRNGVIDLETLPITLINSNSAQSGGNVTSDGGGAIITRGVCWNTTPSPTIANNLTVNGRGTGTFTANLTGLAPGTTYYVRSYATNSVGTIYGNEVTLTTLYGVVVLTTSATSAITAYTATSGGNIITDEGAAVTARGVCWNTSPNPTTANNKTIDGSGLGCFTCSITGLSANTLYYLRAYGINSVGTTYGNEVSFTSQDIVSDIDGNIYNTVKIGAQTWMAENLKTSKYNDGTIIPNVTDAPAWNALTTPSYCFYNNDASNKITYGALYNYYTVNTGKLAPTGWHVPTDSEWTTLENYLIANGYNYDSTTTGNKCAKSLAATIGWTTLTGIGFIGNDLTKNNTSGFAALPGGFRYDNGDFGFRRLYGTWWSTTEDRASDAWIRRLSYYNSEIIRGSTNKQVGFSVRCVRDY